MRFKQFLNEFEDDVNEPFSLHGFTHNLQIIIDRKLFLWRGVHLSDTKKLGTVYLRDFDENINPYVSVYEFGERQQDRESVTGDNLLLNVMAKWDGFPNRKRSYFVTQSTEHVDKFGDDYGLVIPADSIRTFAYMPYDVNEPAYGSKGNRTQRMINDISNRFRLLIQAVRECVLDRQHQDDELRAFIVKTAKDVNAESAIYDKVFNRPNGKTFDEAVRFVDTLIKAKRDWSHQDVYHISTHYSAFHQALQEQGLNSVQEMLDEITPASMDASTYSLKSIPEDNDDNSEIWFDGPYLLIKGADLRNKSANELTKILSELSINIDKDNDFRFKIEI